MGSGGNGSVRVSSSQGGNGGGAGAYAGSTNVNLGTGPISVTVGTAGGVNRTTVRDTGANIKVQADYGISAVATNGGSGAGGTFSNSLGDVRSSGGSGGNSVSGDAGGGGGGSGGPSGGGQNGAVGAVINGGSADFGIVPQQTAEGTIGNSGTEWDSTHGCGGGGAGGVGGGSRDGGDGGPYGGGGGGTDSGTSTDNGIGGNGLIILRWNPAVAPNTGFLQMFSRKENKPCLDNLSSLLRWQLRQLLALSRLTLLPNRT